MAKNKVSRTIYKISAKVGALTIKGDKGEIKHLMDYETFSSSPMSESQVESEVIKEVKKPTDASKLIITSLLCQEEIRAIEFDKFVELSTVITRSPSQAKN